MRFMLIFVSLITSISTANATPFDICPSKAYLFQANPVQVYGVNLVTGQTSLLAANTGLQTNINGVGFDFEDRYIYGYDTGNKRIVRLGKDFQAQILNTSGLPTAHTFYVGDVYNHVYYLYRTGEGLFKIDLSPLDTDPTAVLDVVQISSVATVRLTDFAFHPGNGQLYGVDNNTGGLYHFNTTDGAENLIGNIGVTGTFGAGYFDVNGYYYISRNSDGHIFRIDLSDPESGSYPAELFATGPYSNQNDGARCANAPVIDEDSTIDFGDAPSSYSTLLDDNGPRHAIDGITYLGAVSPDGEQDGFVGQLSDNKAGYQDEDGVGFVTAIEAGLDSIVVVNASTSGVLNAWIDWNKDGDFADSNEHVFNNTPLSEGDNTLFFTVPNDVTMGETWSRFRFSQQSDLSYVGGAQSGEVEDHPVIISENGMSVRYFPSADVYATVAYEDNWPYTDDYDLNDVVMRYRVTEVLNSGSVEQIEIDGYLAAYGAGYNNGFAFQLDGLTPDQIDTDLSRQLHNGTQLNDLGLELESDNAVLVVSEDLSKLISPVCTYFRTQTDCDQSIQFSFSFTIRFKEGADVSNLMTMPYNPFVFATPGRYHGEGLPLHPGRGLEIHLANHEPTSRFNFAQLIGLGDDDSQPQQSRYFKTSNQYPWPF